MTVGQKEQVFISAIHGEFWVVLQHLEIKCCKIVCATQGPARVAACGAVDHSNDISSNLGSYCFQIGHNERFTRFGQQS